VWETISDLTNHASILDPATKFTSGTLVITRPTSRETILFLCRPIAVVSSAHAPPRVSLALPYSPCLSFPSRPPPSHPSPCLAASGRSGRRALGFAPSCNSSSRVSSRAALPCLCPLAERPPPRVRRSPRPPNSTRASTPICPSTSRHGPRRSRSGRSVRSPALCMLARASRDLYRTEGGHLRGAFFLSSAHQPSPRHAFWHTTDSCSHYS